MNRLVTKRLATTRSARRAIALALLTLGAGVVVPQPAGASIPVPNGRQEIQLLRATAKYNSVHRAIADGFVPTDECAELPGVGGMGYHYVNYERLADGVIEPYKPDILLYAEDDWGRLRLVAVEWFAADPDQDLDTDDGRPTLFGQPFDGPMPGHGPGMPIHFDLHAWIWHANPAGTYAAWNPTISC